METILDKYYRAIDALLDLEQYERDNIRQMLGHLNARVSGMLVEQEELDGLVSDIESGFSD